MKLEKNDKIFLISEGVVFLVPFILAIYGIFARNTYKDVDYVNTLLAIGSFFSTLVSVPIFFYCRNSDKRRALALILYVLLTGLLILYSLSFNGNDKFADYVMANLYCGFLGAAITALGLVLMDIFGDKGTMIYLFLITSMFFDFLFLSSIQNVVTLISVAILLLSLSYRHMKN